jgi:phage terminase small subunit
MPGPKPTPTALKIVRGNPGKRALPKNEPKLATVAPPRPAELNRAEVRAWDELTAVLLKMRVLTEAEFAAVEGAAVELAAYRKAHWHISREGEVVDGRLNPWMEVRAHAWKRLYPLLGAFGMTPADRTKVAAALSEAADPFEEFLKN